MGTITVRGSKNLGLIKAIHIGVNPPLNVRLIWFDDNLTIKIHKVYDFATSTWIPLASVSGVPVNGLYTYIAYASNCSGADFALIKTGIHTHFAIITNTSAIVPISTMFTGRWSAYCGVLSRASPIGYLELRLISKGHVGGVPNTAATLEIGDLVEGFKDEITYWSKARYNGGNILTDRANYSPIVENDIIIE